MTTTPTIQLERPLAWRYTSLRHVGRCRIDGGDLRLRLRLAAFDRTVPDVLAVEEWLTQTLAQPTTVAELALAAADHWSMRATVTGSSATHGPITARSHPK
jgi:hypothetical protein